MSLVTSLVGTDAVGTALHAALDGLSARQDVIADNIANVDTPHFRATSVDFESSLRSAISDGRLEAAAGTGGDQGSGLVVTTTAATQTPVGANDNNVDLRKETIAAMQTSFQYQILSRAESDRLGLVKTAAGAS